MKRYTLPLGVLSLVLATAAFAQTTSQPSSSSSSTPSSSSSTDTSSTSSSTPSSGTRKDTSKGAKEQQSQKKRCTGDNSNVNCKETTNSTGTNPK